MKNWRKILISFVFLVSLFVSLPVMAQDANDAALYGTEAQKTGLATTLGLSDSDPRIVAANLIRVFLGFLGLIAVGLVLFAGWLYMTSNGEADKIEKAKNILKNAAIGLLIILSAFGIVTFILSRILGATQSGLSGSGNPLPGGGWFDGGSGFYLAGHEPTSDEKNVFRDQAVLLSFNAQVAREVVTPSFFSIDKVAEYQLTAFETEISTDTVSTTANNGPIDVSVSTSSDLRTIILRPIASCDVFNGVSTTTHKNCLPAWSKFHVKINTGLVSMKNIPVNCTAMNRVCEFDFYTSETFGEGRPVIKNITPTGGFCVAAPNTACLVNSDCGGTDICDLATPNAAPSNFVTISGNNFGNVAGEVTFESSLGSVGANLAACAQSWSDHEVVVQLPESVKLPLGATSSIKLVTDGNKIDFSNDKYGPKIKNLLINNIKRPGLCSVVPSHGTTSAPIWYKGEGLRDAWGYFGSPLSSTTRMQSSDQAILDTEISARVPDLIVGTTSAFALRGKVYSNFVAFHKDQEEYNGPVITGLSPLTGPKGQYITISGSGFGNASKEYLGFGHGSSSYIVIFSKNSSISAVQTALSNNGAGVCKNGADCSVVGDNFVEGSFVFPKICSDDLWKSNQVIVKVPEGVDDSVKNYYLFLAYPKQNGQGGWLIGSDQIQENTQDAAKQEYFVADKDALMLPGLCAIRPASGLPNTPVDLYGENFPARDIDKNIYFTANVKANSSFLPFNTIFQADYATATVPTGAVTGAINIRLDGGNVSNPIGFRVGACAADNDCGNPGSKIFCCPAGSARPGRCEKGNDVQNACYASLRSSVFAWTFSTYLATSSETCSGFANANACMLSATCPNSPGECQSQEGALKADSQECSSGYCNTAYKDFCANGKCAYDSATNHCASSTDGTAANIATCAVADNSFALNGVTGGKTVEAYCNEVETGVTNGGVASSGHFWQYRPRFGASCVGSSIMALGGWCTIVDAAKRGVPCQTCDAGFSCNAGKCVIGDAVCAGNTKCDGTSATAKCREDFTCECCCKVDNSAQDCCGGLTCTPKLCVNEAVDATNQALYGQCTGCTKYSGGVIDQEASNLACSCNSDSRYCNTEPQVYINGEWKPNLTGICQDRAKLGEACSGGGKTPDISSPSETLHMTHSIKLWQSAKNGACPVGTFIDYNNKCTVGTQPLNCTTDGAASSTVVIGREVICREVVPGTNYWQLKNISPCPSNSYLNNSSTNGDSWCTIATTLPASCTKIGATSTVIVSGLETVCSQNEAWLKPDVTYRQTNYSTTTYKISQAVATGMTAAYWQTDDDIADKFATFKDFNGSLTLGSHIATCSVAMANLATTTVLAGATTTCHLVNGLAYGYWQLRKPPNSPCPPKTFLSAASSSDLYNTYPWCTVGDRPLTCKSFNQSTTTVNGISLGVNNIAKCTVFSYGASTTNKAGFCSSDLPLCNNDLQCDPNSCTCQMPATSTETSTVKAGESCTKNGVGACTVGAPSCDTSVTSLQCYSDNTSADCRCCCNPGVYDPVAKKYNNPDTKAVAGGVTLVCLPNKSPCGGDDRGLFCGCTSDNQCNNGADGCGLDTCCNQRPFAVATKPHNLDTGVCRNTQISMTFNSPMNQGSFTGNIIVAGDYGSDLCPTDTSYLTTIVKPSRFSWFNRLFNRVIAFFLGNDSAFALDNRTMCSVEGRVTAEDGKKIVFSPIKMLAADKDYYVIVLGDKNATDSRREGVLSANEISLHDEGSVSGHTMDFKYASSSIDVNGRNIFGYTWHFKTKTLAAENKGVCLLDRVEVNTDGTSTSWVFNTSLNDPADDTNNFDTATDSDKNFIAHAFTKDNQIISSTTEYAWKWNWSSQNEAVVKVFENAQATGHNNAYERMVKAEKNQKDAQTTVTAEAEITNDTINFPSTKNKKTSGKANVRVFMCNNPWPPLNDRASWPWKDQKNNCRGSLTCTKDVNFGKSCTSDANCGNVAGACGCESNNFEFYYCRDAGGPGTADDLPVISTNPVSLGKNQGYCDAGSNYNKPCSDDGQCEGAKCKIILKEFMFGRDKAVTVQGIAFEATTSLANKKTVDLKWASTSSATKYKVYYGLRAGQYANIIDVATTSCGQVVCTTSVNNLQGGKLYYFVFTALNANNNESPYSAEAKVYIP